MGKRMTATEKWDKMWFMNLNPKHKCLWIYINDKCDQAGMWEVNYKLASMHIGEEISEKDFVFFEDRIEKFSNGKFWIVDHVLFQCGTLSEKSPAHKPIFNLLKKYTLLNRVLNRVPSTLQEKEIEKEEEKDKEMDKEKYITVENRKIYEVLPLLEYYEASLNGRQREQGLRAWRDVVGEWFESNLQMPFNDGKHVLNAFNKYYMNNGKPKSNGYSNGTVKKFTIDDLK